MIDYEKITHDLIHSIMNFTFEFSIDENLNKMELREVTNEELENLGEAKVKENFLKGTFKIKLSEDKFIDINSLNEHCRINNIKEPVLFLNPQFKYVRWEITENLMEPQLKKHIKNQLKNNNEINFDELQKNLLEENLKGKDIDGYISDIPLKLSENIQQGKMYMQSSCNRENAYKLIIETISEVDKEREKYIKQKIKRDIKISCLYFVFILIIIAFWFVSQQKLTSHIWLTTSIAFVLFIVPLGVLNFINYSFIDSLFFKEKASKKYRSEFNILID